MPRPGDTINRRLVLDRTPDAAPVVRVFRNGVRTATVTLTGIATSYLVSYLLPSSWLTSDYVQIVAYPLYGGAQVADELFGGRLGSVTRPGDTVTAAIVLDRTPDATPTLAVSREGVVDGAVVRSVTAGAVATEFVAAVTIPTGWASGFGQAEYTALFGGGAYSCDLWGSGIAVWNPTTPVSADLVWSLPEDRNAGTVAALAAVRSRVQVGEETDVRLVFDAAGTAALAADLTAWTLEAEIALSTSADPLTTAPTITVNSATEFEVAFAAESASEITPGTYVLSVYRTGSGVRTELARVSVIVDATSFSP